MLRARFIATNRRSTHTKRPVVFHPYTAGKHITKISLKMHQLHHHYFGMLLNDCTIWHFLKRWDIRSIVGVSWNKINDDDCSNLRCNSYLLNKWLKYLVTFLKMLEGNTYINKYWKASYNKRSVNDKSLLFVFNQLLCKKRYSRKHNFYMVKRWYQKKGRKMSRSVINSKDTNNSNLKQDGLSSQLVWKIRVKVFLETVEVV